MMDVQIKYLIKDSIWKCLCILLICARLGNAQDSGQYLELSKNTGTFKAALSKGFHPGGSIIVNGTVNPDANRFFINLEDDSGSKVYLHVNPRFDEEQVVFSHKINEDWRPGYDQTAINLYTSMLSRGAQFEINLLCNATGYVIKFNQISYFFNHRFDTSTIRNIKFSGDVTINSVLYKPGNASCAMEGCHTNAHCVSEDDNFYYCKCDDGYSGPLCQVSCKDTGCTGNNVCIINNGEYTCRSRTDLADDASSSSLRCRTPYVPVDTECIWVDLTSVNWDTARINCQERGGFLLEPDFPANFKQYMSTNYPETDNTGFWVGGADRGLHRWIWVTSLKNIQEDFPWGEGEPNDLEWNSIKEDCMSLYTHSGKPYFYNDAHCDVNVYYICESPPLIPPTAAALVDDSMASIDQGALDIILQMQVAILLMLIVAMVIVTGVLVYKNMYIVRKAYSSFGDNSISFRNQDAGKLHEEEDN